MMTLEEARHILLAYRPDADDRNDPEIAEALALAGSGPELGRWLEDSLETQDAFRRLLQDCQPPEGLKAQILEAHESFVAPKPVHRRREFLAAAAALAALIAISALVSQTGPEDRDFADFRNRTVRTVIREYRMDITTGDADAVRTFLRDGGLNVELPVAAPLEQVPLIGAGRLTWRGSPVAMVCYETDAKQKLFLFAIDRAAVDSPPDVPGAALRISSLETISWSAGDKAYVLAGEMDAEALRRLSGLEG